MHEKQVGLQDQVQWCVLGATVPGINFLENDSPIVNNVTFLVLLLMVLPFGYAAKTVDVETAYLYGDLDEEIYMKCPQGMSNV